jgi:SAM-dependent methyltransferase
MTVNPTAVYWDRLSGPYLSETTITCDDFHYGPLMPGDRELRLLPTQLDGLRCLELGGGAAQNSIFLAKNGAAQCVSIDISGQQSLEAAKLADQNGVNIQLAQADVARIPISAELFGKFDLVHSSGAICFADEPAQMIHDAVRYLAPDGRLLLSTIHPLFSAEWFETEDEERGLFVQDYFHPPEEFCVTEEGDGETTCKTFPVSQIVEWFFEAGLILERLIEPPATDHEPAPYTSPDWMEWKERFAYIPGTVIYLARHRP